MAESLPRCRFCLSHFVRAQDKEEREGGTAHVLCPLLPQTDSKLSSLSAETLWESREVHSHYPSAFVLGPSWKVVHLFLILSTPNHSSPFSFLFKWPRRGSSTFLAAPGLPCLWKRENWSVGYSLGTEVFKCMCLFDMPEEGISALKIPMREKGKEKNRKCSDL